MTDKLRADLARLLELTRLVQRVTRVTDNVQRIMDDTQHTISESKTMITAQEQEQVFLRASELIRGAFSYLIDGWGRPLAGEIHPEASERIKGFVTELAQFEPSAWEVLPTSLYASDEELERRINEAQQELNSRRRSRARRNA